MRTIGYVRVSTDKQAERGCSLDAQAEKIRAMALVQGAELSEIIVESGESAKSLNRPGMAKLLALVDAGKVKAHTTKPLENRYVARSKVLLMDSFGADRTRRKVRGAYIPLLGRRQMSKGMRRRPTFEY